MKRRMRRRVFLVDDHPAILAGLKEHLALTRDLMVCGTAADTESALSGIVGRRAEVAVIDLQLAGQDSGLNLISKLRQGRERVPVLVYTGFAEPDQVRLAVQAGANGYLVKTDWTALVPALRALLAGGTFFTPAMARELSASPPPALAGGGKLSGRQARILALMGQGLDIKDIAGHLQQEVTTTYTHCRRMCGKLQVADLKALQFVAVNTQRARTAGWRSTTI